MLIPNNKALKAKLARNEYDLVLTLSNSTLTDESIPTSKILQNSFSVNRFSVTGSTIEIGSATAAEMQVTIDNSDGTFDDWVFEGATIFARLSATISNSTEYMNIGYFNVDEVVRQRNSIQLVCLDKMVRLDKTVTGTINYSTYTPSTLISKICTDCGIGSWGSSASSLVNGSVSLATPTSENITYRTILQWICQITGTCAYINENGTLVLQWYHAQTYSGTDAEEREEQDKITPSNRFSSSLDFDPITISNVSITVGDTTSAYNSDNTYTLSIEGNELIDSTNVGTILSGLAGRLVGFTYTPFTAETLGLQWLQPLDKTVFVDADDTEHNVIITDWTFSRGQNLQLAGKGESATRKGYASNPPFTAQQSRIIEEIKKTAQETNIDDKITAVFALNDAVNSGVMLHSTTYNNQLYYHDAATLADSDFILIANNGGFAWTSNGWNSGNPTFEYGLNTNEAQAVLNILTAYEVNADVIRAGSIQSDKIAAGAITADKIHSGAITIGGLGQDVLDLIEQGSDNVDVHATAGTLSTNNYPLTTTEQVTELTEGQTVEITFPNGIDFTLNTSGSTYLYKPRTVSIGNNTYTLMNANGTTDWCNVKNSTDYSGNVAVRYIVRTISNTLVLCELIEAENVQSVVLETHNEPYMLQVTEAVSSPSIGTVLKCNLSNLTYGLAISADSASPSSYDSPYFSADRRSFYWLLSKAHYNENKGIADAYSSSDFYQINGAAANYTGTSSSSASSSTKACTISGFSLTNGVTVDITFNYGNTVSSGSEYLNVNNTGNKKIWIIQGYDWNTFNSSAYINWTAGETRRFTYYADGDAWGISKPEVYYTVKTEAEPTGVSSVNIILENLRTSSGTALRAFELRYEPYSTAPMAIDQEARDAANRALLAALAAQSDIDNLDIEGDIADYMQTHPISSEITTWYGTCATGASTAAKAVTCSGFTLKQGAIINVKFDNANTGDYPTLNVNSTGAKDIYVSNARLRYGTSQATNPYNWTANAVVQFMYNGSVWIMSQTSADLILGKWCATNDITMINGGKIATGSIAADSINVNSITALTATVGNAFLANLLAYNATITGLLKIVMNKISSSSSEYTTEFNAAKNTLAAQFGYSSYSAAPSYLQTYISALAEIQVSFRLMPKNSPLKLYTKDGNSEVCTAALHPLGLTVATSNSDGIDSETDITKFAYYGEDANIPGQLYLRGIPVPSHYEESSIESITIPANSNTAVSNVITFTQPFSTHPEIYFSVNSEIAICSFSCHVNFVNQRQFSFVVAMSGTFTVPKTISVRWRARGI